MEIVWKIMRTESISPSGLGTDGLKDLTGLHQVLDVLTQHGVLGLQPEVFLLHFVHPLSEVVQGVLQLQNLSQGNDIRNRMFLKPGHSPGK